MVHKVVKTTDKFVEKASYWVPAILFMAGVVTWLAREVEPIAQYGWAADVLTGFVLTSFFMGMTGALLAGWRYFNPIEKTDPISVATLQISRTHEPSRPVVIPRFKEYCHRSPSFLMAFFNGRTMLQASLLIEPYIGLWLSVKGPIITTYDGIDEVGASLLVDGVNVSCRFKKDVWGVRLARYNEKEILEAGGFIGRSQNGQQLYLEDCEISL